MQIRKSDFLFAMGRLDDFKAVHAEGGINEIYDALDIMLESLGITDIAEMDLINWLHSRNGHGQEGGFLLGLIIGINACKNAS